MARSGELARRVVKVVAGGADLVRRRRGVVVLIYHRVGGRTDSQIDIPLPLFERQIAHLAASGRATTLDAALDALAAPAPSGPGPDPVVVTFDDGTEDFVDAAFPVLERFAIPVCLYLATEFVDSGSAFPWGSRPASWTAIADLMRSDLVTVGSHTHRHLLLDRVPIADAADDLDRSIDLIATHLGGPPAHFAYPKALPAGPAIADEIRKRFRSAALAGCRPNVYGRTDPQRLARSPLQVSDAMRWFRHKVDGGMATEDDLRRLLNRRRYAGAVT